MPHNENDFRFLVELEKARREREEQEAQADATAAVPADVPLSDPTEAVAQLEGLLDPPEAPQPETIFSGQQPPGPDLDLTFQEQADVAPPLSAEAQQSLELLQPRPTPTIGPAGSAGDIDRAVAEQVEQATQSIPGRIEQALGGATGLTGAFIDVATAGQAQAAADRVEAISGEKSGAAIAGDVASYFTDLLALNGGARLALGVAKRAGMRKTLGLLSGSAGLTDDLALLLPQVVAEDVALNAARLAQGEVTKEDAFFDVLLGLGAGTTLRAGALGIKRLRGAQAEELADAAEGILDPAKPSPVRAAAFEMPDGTVHTMPDGAGFGSHIEVLEGLDPVTQRIINDGEPAGTVRSGFVDENGVFLDRAEAAQRSGADVGESSFIEQAQIRQADELPLVAGTEEFGKRPGDLPAQDILDTEPGRLLRSFSAISDAHKTKGGSTIDWRTGNDLGGEDLYSTAIRPGDDLVIEGRDLTPLDVQKFAQEFADDLSQPGRTIGTWQDGDRAVLDVVETFADRDEAMKIGAQNAQDAILHLGTFEEIRLVDQLQNAPGTVLRVAAPTAIGAAIGGAQGDTFEERVRNAAIGAMGAGVIGFGIPLARGTGGFIRLSKADGVPPWWTTEGKAFWRDPSRTDAAMRKFQDPEMFSAAAQWRGLRGSDLRKALRDEFPDATPAELDGMVKKGRDSMEKLGAQMMDTRVVAEQGMVGPALREAPPPRGKKGSYYELRNPLKTGGGAEYDSMIHAIMDEGFATDGWRFYHNVGDVVKQAMGEQDGDLYLKFLAITSSGVDALKSNITNANKAMMLWKTLGKGQPVDEKTAKAIFASVGQRDLSDSLAAATRGEFVPGKGTPKIFRYYKALSGDENAVVNDLWMARIFGFPNALSDRQYRFIEQEVFRLANVTGQTPRDVQAALWSGAKSMWARDVSTKGISDAVAYADHLVSKMTKMAGDIDATNLNNAMGEVIRFLKNPDTKQSQLFREAWEEQNEQAQEIFTQHMAQMLKDEKGAVASRQVVQMLAVLGGAAGGAAFSEDPLQGAVLGAAVAGGGGYALLRNAEKISGVIGHTAQSGRTHWLDLTNKLRRRGTTPLLSTTGGLAPSGTARGVAEGASAFELHSARALRSGKVRGALDELDKRMQKVDRMIDEAELPREEAWNQAQKVRKAGGGFDMDVSLPPEWPADLRLAFREAYNVQDQLSETLRKQGWMSGELQQVVQENQGSYLRRSYQAFTEPDWEHTVKRNHAQVYNDAVNWLEDRLTVPRREVLENMSKGELATLANRHDLGIPITAEKDDFVFALSHIPPEKAAADAVTLANRLLHLGEDHILGAVRSGKLGRKDLSALMKRGDIAPEIRALLGEVTDPRQNLIRSVHDTSKLIANHDFQTEIRGMGLRQGWLSPEEARVAAHTVPLVNDTAAFSELRGMFTTPEVKAAWEVFESAQPFLGSDSVAWKAFLRATALPKLAKTVLSPVTHIRNVISNGAFMAMGGDVRLAGGSTGPGVVGALRRFRNDLAYRRRLIELGVVGQGFNVQEATQFFKKGNAEEGLIRSMERGLRQSKTGRALQKIAEGPGVLYRWEDEIWKLNAFDARMWNFSHWRHGVEPDALDPAVREGLEREVAQKVLDTYPTYNISPRLAQVVRSIPFFGPFISWAVAVPRNVINQSLDIHRTLRNPQSPGEFNHAMARALGVLSAAGGVTAVGVTANRMQGIDREDELALREFLPDWNRNGANIYTEWDPASLKGEYVPGGQFDALDMMKSPIRAILSGVESEEEVARIAIDAASEIADPFISRELFSGALASLWLNQDENGRPIFNPTEWADGEAMADAMAFMWEKSRPGALDSMARLEKAAQSDDPDDWDREIKAAMGLRISPVDVPRSLGFDTRDFVEDIRLAAKDIRQAQSDLELQVEVEQLVENQQRLWARFQRKTNAAQHLGMSAFEVHELLTDSGMRSDIAEAFVSGRFKPYVSNTLLDSPDGEVVRFLLELASSESDPNQKPTR